LAVIERIYELNGIYITNFGESKSKIKTILTNAGNRSEKAGKKGVNWLKSIKK
jgi:hypothetical protein